MSHCPLAHGAPALLEQPTLRALGAARGATPAQASRALFSTRRVALCAEGTS